MTSGALQQAEIVILSKKKTMKILLTLLMFVVAVFQTDAQQRLIAHSLTTNEIHHLKLPQHMKVTYMGQTKKYFVEGVTGSGLLTSEGPISFHEIGGVRAARFKNGGKQVLGVAAILLGALITAGGIAMATDDFYEGRGVALSIIGGVAITAGGISLVSFKRGYEQDKWQLESLPERQWGERIITQHMGNQ